jgi:hypothetical protein
MWYYPAEEQVEEEQHPVIEWWTDEGLEYLSRYIEPGWTRAQIEETIAQLWNNSDEITVYDDEELAVVADAVERYLREEDE